MVTQFLDVRLVVTSESHDDFTIDYVFAHRSVHADTA
jgi:hypothetical protein